MGLNCKITSMGAALDWNQYRHPRSRPTEHLVHYKSGWKLALLEYCLSKISELLRKSKLDAAIFEKKAYRGQLGMCRLKKHLDWCTRKFSEAN